MLQYVNIPDIAGWGSQFSPKTEAIQPRFAANPLWKRLWDCFLADLLAEQNIVVGAAACLKQKGFV